MYILKLVVRVKIGETRNRYSQSLPPIHSLNVMQVVVLQLFPLQLEGVGDQTRLWRPRVRTQMHLHWNLKSLKFYCFREEKNKNKT